MTKKINKTKLLVSLTKELTKKLTNNRIKNLNQEKLRKLEIRETLIPPPKKM